MRDAHRKMIENDMVGSAATSNPHRNVERDDWANLNIFQSSDLLVLVMGALRCNDGDCAKQYCGKYKYLVTIYLTT